MKEIIHQPPKTLCFSLQATAPPLRHLLRPRVAARLVSALRSPRASSLQRRLPHFGCSGAIAGMAVGAGLMETMLSDPLLQVYCNFTTLQALSVPQTLLMRGLCRK
jgi:hypothetical protein